MPLCQGVHGLSFILRAQNGREVIARIPTPIAGPPHYTTSSEVATMDFLRTVLKLPVPGILGYSATSGSPVGVKHVMSQIAEIERKIFDFCFPAYGSLYYKRDLDDETQIPVVDLGSFFWYGERSKMEIDLGSCMSSHLSHSVGSLTSAARREMAVIQQHAKPQPRQTFLLPTNFDIHSSEHISLLSHIIDWQDAVIFPRLMQAGYPVFCEHDSSKPQSLTIPSFPDDFDKMNADEQRQAMSTFRIEEENLYYTAATGVHKENHMDVLRLPHLSMQQYLLKQTGYPWDADVINLRAALVGITTPSVWSKIWSAPCPVEFSDEEREAALAESQEWNESERLLTRVTQAVEGNRQFCEEMVRQAEEGQEEIGWRNWPYKDDGDDSEPPLVER
ncbi:hypothetical protein BJX65DRAFT_320472 [Aspergillus insuetus]